MNHPCYSLYSILTASDFLTSSLQYGHFCIYSWLWNNWSIGCDSKIFSKHLVQRQRWLQGTKMTLLGIDIQIKQVAPTSSACSIGTLFIEFYTPYWDEICYDCKFIWFCSSSAAYLLASSNLLWVLAHCKLKKSLRPVEIKKIIPREPKKSRANLKW